MPLRNDILKYFIDQYYNGDLQKVSHQTGYTIPQLQAWLEGRVEPQHDTVEYIVHAIFTPEFKVIVEYGKFDSSEPILTQLKTLLAGHEDHPGLYAFYDSMGNLVYVGKATRLLDEVYAAIRRDIHIPFPRGISNVPEKRYEIISYISAYDVGTSDWIDYPKHVESLILRISKPLLNKNIGTLEKAFQVPEK